MIKAVLFDIDGVLLDSFEANLKAHQDLMIQVGHQPPTREEFKTMFHLSMLDTIRKTTGLVSEEEIERIWTLGQDRTHYPYNLIKMAEDVPSTIKILHEKFILGLVTSRMTEGIFLVPQLNNLKHFFQTVVAFEDVTHHKPDPEPLLLAVQRLGVEPSEAIYIGDAHTDFQAAKAAGMKFIMYNNEKIQGADYYVSSFTGLLEVLLPTHLQTPGQ
jgi:pyrophosphatase PpaX